VAEPSRRAECRGRCEAQQTGQCLLEVQGAVCCPAFRVPDFVEQGPGVAGQVRQLVAADNNSPLRRFPDPGDRVRFDIFRETGPARSLTSAPLSPDAPIMSIM